LIFGWGAGDAQDLGEIAPTVCPNCHNEVYLHHIKSDKQVSLFFVPVANYGSNEYLACPICRHGLGVKPEHGGPINRMRAATKLYRQGMLREDFYRPQVVEFWRRLGVAPSGVQVIQPVQGPLPAASAVGVGAKTELSLADQLAEYGKLHVDGVLSDEEFAAVKRRLLET
jgi:uncharacterized protein YbaR (Trm112 family)